MLRCPVHVADGSDGSLVLLLPPVAPTEILLLASTIAELEEMAMPSDSERHGISYRSQDQDDAKPIFTPRTSQQLKQAYGAPVQTRHIPNAPLYRMSDPWSTERSLSPPFELHDVLIPRHDLTLQALARLASTADSLHEHHVDGTETPMYRQFPLVNGSAGSLPDSWRSSEADTRSVTLVSNTAEMNIPNVDKPRSWRQRALHVQTVLELECLLAPAYALFRSMPREIYTLLLFRLPLFYLSRVQKVVEDAEISEPEIVRLYLTTARDWMAHENSTVDVRPSRISLSGLPAPSWKSADGVDEAITPAIATFKQSWERLIGSLLQEWQTVNIISALLSASILTLLSVNGTSNDPVIRTTSVVSLLCSLWSIICASLYTVQFSPMKRMQKAASWVEEVRQRQRVLWNVWALLAMPVVWLLWSLVFFIAAVMSYVWRTDFGSTDADSPPTSRDVVLGTRIAVSCVLCLGILCFFAMLRTLRRYNGDEMDSKWKKKIASLASRASATRPHASGTTANHPYPSYTIHGPHRPRSDSHSNARVSDLSPSGSSVPASESDLRQFVAEPQGTPPEPIQPRTYRSHGHLRSSMKPVSQQSHRPRSGLGRTVRIQPELEIINPSDSDISSAPGGSQRQASARVVMQDGEMRIADIANTEQREWPDALTGFPWLQVLSADGFVAFRGVQLPVPNDEGNVAMPPQLLQTGLASSEWTDFVEELRAAWNSWQTLLVSPEHHRNRLTLPEVWFQICYNYANGCFAPYGVYPILCEERLINGSVAYSVYMVDIRFGDDWRYSFHRLPDDVTEVVLLWEEPIWDDAFRETWTIRQGDLDNSTEWSGSSVFRERIEQEFGIASQALRVFEPSPTVLEAGRSPLPRLSENLRDGGFTVNSRLRGILKEEHYHAPLGTLEESVHVGSSTSLEILRAPSDPGQTGPRPDRQTKDNGGQSSMADEDTSESIREKPGGESGETVYVDGNASTAYEGTGLGQEGAGEHGDSVPADEHERNTDGQEET
ncbi:unnamed protein product [Peniophora sp. CBMAI 1063]|nr:unnamed protein product [Peniophora sp. CBMAI 1063]